jgi:hypothetical protein
VRSETVTAACGKDGTADANHHHPDLCRAADHHCHDAVDHYHDEAVRCYQNPGAAVHCCRYPDVAAYRRNRGAVDDLHSAVCFRNPDAAVHCCHCHASADDPHSAACSFQNLASADDPPSAAYFQNLCAGDDPKIPDAAAHHRYPVAQADGDRSEACCSAVSRPAPCSQNHDAADDRQTA